MSLYKIEFVHKIRFSHHDVYISADSFCQIGTLIREIEKQEADWKFNHLSYIGGLFCPSHPELRVWRVR